MVPGVVIARQVMHELSDTLPEEWLSVSYWLSELKRCDVHAPDELPQGHFLSQRIRRSADAFQELQDLSDGESCWKGLLDACADRCLRGWQFQRLRKWLQKTHGSALRWVSHRQRVRACCVAIMTSAHPCAIVGGFQVALASNVQRVYPALVAVLRRR